MTAEQMWRDFTAARGPAEADYEAWAFGGDPDGLAELVLAGIKTATASASSSTSAFSSRTSRARRPVSSRLSRRRSRAFSVGRPPKALSR